MAEQKKAEERMKIDEDPRAEPTMEIKSITSDGEINVEFSVDMKVPEDG